MSSKPNQPNRTKPTSVRAKATPGEGKWVTTSGALPTGSGGDPQISYSTQHLRAQPTVNPGSVLFNYLNRPTNPELAAVRTPATPPRIVPLAKPERDPALEVALSQRPMPKWKTDGDGPPTLLPVPPSIVAPPAPPAPELQVVGTLTRVDGPNAGRVISLPPDQLTIGRSKHADFHLAEDGVSRQHARICWVDDSYVLEDLGSQNGTYVANQNVSAVRLEQGDLIRLGPSATLRFCWMDGHQKKLIRELFETSVRDPLTGAFNRRHFSERLEAELAFSRRHRTELSLLILDIDYFKKINDQYGHVEGDRVLRELSHLAETHLRTEDMFARYGGEEFVVLLRGVPLLGAIRAAERLRVAIGRGVTVGDPPLAVSVSIGCASLACIEEPLAGSLIRVADKRLYEAKQAGRGRVVAGGYAAV